MNPMTTLENSYCVPRTEDEWETIDALNPRIELRIKGKFVYTFKERGKRRLYVCHREKGNAQEIPVYHFLDLLQDRITPWRLEEVGFVEWINLSCVYELEVDGGKKLRVYCDQNQLSVSMDVESDGVIFHITTFTDLLTLIRFLTQNTNKP